MSLQLFDGDGRPTAEASRHARDVGMAQALDHAEADTPDWGAIALAFVRRYAENNEFFPWYFVTMAAEQDARFPVPDNEKAWGAITKQAIKKGIIADSGKSMPHPRRHAVKATVWRSLIYRAAA